MVFFLTTQYRDEIGINQSFLRLGCKTRSWCCVVQRRWQVRALTDTAKKKSPRLERGKAFTKEGDFKVKEEEVIGREIISTS